MSLKTFLRNLWSSIAKLWHKAEDELKELVPIAIQVVNNIKTVMDNPVIDIITAIIPTTIDDKAAALIRKWIPKVILELNMINAIANEDDINKQLNAILAQLKLSSDEAKNIFYHGLSSLIIEKLSDGKFDWSDATAVSEWYYQHEVKKIDQ